MILNTISQHFLLNSIIKTRKNNTLVMVHNLVQENTVFNELCKYDCKKYEKPVNIQIYYCVYKYKLILFTFVIPLFLNILNVTHEQIQNLIFIYRYTKLV